MPDTKLLRISEVAAKIGYKPKSIYGLIERAGFPRGIQMNGSAVRWDQAEVEKWIEARRQARDAGQGAAHAPGP